MIGNKLSKMPATLIKAQYVKTNLHSTHPPKLRQGYVDFHIECVINEASSFIKQSSLEFIFKEP